MDLKESMDSKMNLNYKEKKKEDEEHLKGITKGGREIGLKEGVESVRAKFKRFNGYCYLE